MCRLLNEGFINGELRPYVLRYVLRWCERTFSQFFPIPQVIPLSTPLKANQVLVPCLSPGELLFVLSSSPLHSFSSLYLAYLEANMISTAT